MTEKNAVQQNVSLLGLVALTVTTVIGAGVFNLCRECEWKPNGCAPNK